MYNMAFSLKKLTNITSLKKRDKEEKLKEEKTLFFYTSNE